jgi:hypothetical protein
VGLLAARPPAGQHLRLGYVFPGSPVRIPPPCVGYGKAYTILDMSKGSRW